ncbi:MAG TPA: four helix bundle protein [Terriglobales bacterium]|nr:four helix bundle protein [Terriglobales bacterium]
MSSSYKDLRVWQNTMDLAETIYRLTEGFPREEIYGAYQPTSSRGGFDPEQHC